MEPVVIVAALFVGALLFLLRKLIIPKYTVVLPYQRGVVTHRGVYEKTLPPGGYWISRLSSLTGVDMRLQVLNVVGQEVLSSDGISMKLSMAGEFSVEDAKKSLYSTVQPITNLHLYAQAAIREVMAGQSFEEILQGRSGLNEKLLEIVQPQANALGFAMRSLQVRDIMLSGDLKRAFAQALTAQKDGMAALERARGETAALRSLANAARLMQETPTLLQLRALQTMEAGKGNTLVLGLGEGGVVVRPK